MPEANYTAPKTIAPPANGVKVRAMNVVAYPNAQGAPDVRAEVHIEDVDNSDNVVGAFRVDIDNNNAVRLLLIAADTPTAGEPATGYWAKRNYRILKHLKSTGVAALSNLSL